MKGTPLLILAGKKGSGKSTVAEHLVEKSGAIAIAQADPMKRFAMRVGIPAENLWGNSVLREIPLHRDRLLLRESEVAVAASDLSADICGASTYYSQFRNWYLVEVLGKVSDNFTARWFLQQLGTECGRSISPDVWANTAQSFCWKLLSGGYKYHERTGLSQNVKSRPPLFVVITDGRFPNEILSVKRQGGYAMLLERAGGSLLDQHASETSLELIPQHWWNKVLHNDGTVEQLKALAEAVVGGILHTEQFSGGTTRV